MNLITASKLLFRYRLHRFQLHLKIPSYTNYGVPVVEMGLLRPEVEWPWLLIDILEPTESRLWWVSS